MGDDLTNDISGVVERDDCFAGLSSFYIRRPTLRIMVYTDSSRENFDPASGYGFSSMVRLVAENNPFYVNIQFTNVNRHEGGVSGARKLTDDAVNPYQYDEIWFFCRGQRNIPRDTRSGAIGFYDGNFPDSELTNDEVDLLWSYMNDGGVLIAGDHANPDPVNPGGPPLNLGRAVGYRIPRAGKLRRWEGAPGPYMDRYDTVISGGNEADGTPQRISLARYPRTASVIDFSNVSHPHPIFCGRNGPIEILPDHMHEGHITIPTRFDDEEEWPRANGIQPRPEVIARGINHRDMSPVDLMAAYDGAVAGVGRVVADSTWHHYQNSNLDGIVRDAAAATRGLLVISMPTSPCGSLLPGSAS